METQGTYRIIACDLDETLLGHDRHVSRKNREAIRRAREKGVKFVPATGRGFPSVQGILRELDLYDRPGEYVLSYNGGAITENRGNRILHFQGLSFEKTMALFQRGLDYGLCIHVYTQDNVYVYNFTADEEAFLRGRMEVTLPREKSMEFLRDVPIGKILFNSTDMALLNRIEGELSDLTGDLEVSYSSARYLEFNPKGVSKGTGLLRLAKLLGVDPRETIAIGDNYNDLAMLQAAGLGVGVANAVDAVKPSCGYITKATYDQSAVAEVIERFIL